MSYENSEPKTLKTLNSDGQVLDDSGNVISDSTDYWKKTYNESEPKPDKILHSDGTIKDSAGNVIQGSTEFNIKKYNQAEPIPAKYLHADGTIDENPGSGGGGSATAYAWDSDYGLVYLSFNIAPSDMQEASTAMVKERVYDYESVPEGVYVKDTVVLFPYILGGDAITDYQKISDTSFTVEYDGDEVTYTRVPSKDFTLWQLSE